MGGKADRLKPVLLEPLRGRGFNEKILDMPVINDKYYMNPQYGKAVERDRMGDAENMRAHGEPQPSWLDYHLGFADRSSAKHAEQMQETMSHPQTQPKKESNESIGNFIYNETAGLRPTSESGSGSKQDLHNARVGAGTVGRNLGANGKKLGKPRTAPTQLTPREAKAVKSYGPAEHAYEDSQNAARNAIGDKNGPTHFYLDHGQEKPKWAKGAPKQSYGPFRNEAGSGDVPKGAKVWIRVY